MSPDTKSETEQMRDLRTLKFDPYVYVSKAFIAGFKTTCLWQSGKMVLEGIVRAVHEDTRLWRAPFVDFIRIETRERSTYGGSGNYKGQNVIVSFDRKQLKNISIKNSWTPLQFIPGDEVLVLASNRFGPGENTISKPRGILNETTQTLYIFDWSLYFK